MKKVSAKFTTEWYTVTDFPLTHPLPLGCTKVEIELNNVNSAFSNAIRRSMIDETRGYSLDASEMDIVKTTDHTFNPMLLNLNISMTPLRLGIDKEIVRKTRLRLDKTNETTSIMYIYASDLTFLTEQPKEPIFNPGIILGFIQPGKRIYIDEIRIISGYGRDHARFQNGVQFIHKPLDVEELTPEELIKSDMSGFKESSLTATPKKYLIRGIFPVTLNADDAVLFMKKALDELKDRFTSIDLDNEELYITKKVSDSHYESTIMLNNETHTVLELLSRTLFELNPDIRYVGYSQEKILSVQYSKDPSTLINQAIAHIITNISQVYANI